MVVKKNLMHNRIRGNMALGNNRTEPGTQYQSSNLSLESSKPRTQHHRPVWSQHPQIIHYQYFYIFCVFYMFCFYRIHIELERTRDMSAMSSRDMYNRQPSPQMERLADKKIKRLTDRQNNNQINWLPNLPAEYIICKVFTCKLGHLYHYLWQSVCRLDIIIFRTLIMLLLYHHQ